MNPIKVRVALFFYSIYVLIVTFHPFEVSPDFSGSPEDLLSALDTLVIDGWNWLGAKDFSLNILLFVPYGVLLYSQWEGNRRSKMTTVTLVTVAGGISSFLIEWGQVFAGRNSSAIDVASNTLGTASGAYVYAYVSCNPCFTVFADGWTRIVSSKTTLCCVSLYALLPLAFTVEQSQAPFLRWDSAFTLQLGNEPSWNRPWLGRIFLVALYRRALSADEIGANFAAGYSGANGTRRIHSNLIALYTFSEGAGDIVGDSSKFGPALNLKMSRHAGVRWLVDSNGIEFTTQGIVKSKSGAAKLVEAVRATDELSVEAWIMPRDTLQDGPAQIVSLSRNSGSRNFTLSQDRADIQFRLRTPVSGSNGTPVLLQTSDGTLSTGFFHIVVTYKAGIERLYVNGVERPENLNLATDGIIGFAARKTPIAQFAHAFLFFSPLSFVVSMFVSSRRGCSAGTWLVSVAMIGGLAAITEAVQAFMLARTIDSAAIGFGIVIGIIGALTGRAFMANEPARRQLRPRGEWMIYSRKATRSKIESGR